jgi:hypothetical protein
VDLPRYSDCRGIHLVVVDSNLLYVPLEVEVNVNIIKYHVDSLSLYYQRTFLNQTHICQEIEELPHVFVIKPYLFPYVSGTHVDEDDYRGIVIFALSSLRHENKVVNPKRGYLNI